MVEIVLAVGILGIALLTALNVSSIALKHHRQNINSANAAQVAETVLNRALSAVANDLPGGTSAAFWAGSFPYPSTAYATGTYQMGREEFNYAIYGVDVPGVGDPAADPPNVLRQVDVYVWWEELGKPGQQRVYTSRLVSQGEQL